MAVTISHRTRTAPPTLPYRPFSAGAAVWPQPPTSNGCCRLLPPPLPPQPRALHPLPPSPPRRTYRSRPPPTPVRTVRSSRQRPSSGWPGRAASGRSPPRLWSHTNKKKVEATAAVAATKPPPICTLLSASCPRGVRPRRCGGRGRAGLVLPAPPHNPRPRPAPCAGGERPLHGKRADGSDRSPIARHTPVLTAVSFFSVPSCVRRGSQGVTQSAATRGGPRPQSGRRGRSSRPHHPTSCRALNGAATRGCNTSTT